jgi:hypothetical protein
VPISSQISITFVFGSSEYDGFQCSAYNDVFGVFLTGPNPNGGNYNGINMATLPNDTAVSITNVNNGSSPCTYAHNPSYYKDNSLGTDIVYEGLTVAITSVRPIISNSTYHIKIAVADIQDEAYDSGVFIKDSIFNCQNVPIVSLTTLGIADTICSGATYTLTGGTPNGGTYYGVGVNDTIYNTSSVAAGTYTISYIYSDVSGCSNIATHTITLEACTTEIDGITTNKNILVVYPNPSDGCFSVETNTIEKQWLQILDVNGKVVLNQEISNKININARDLQEGVYIMNLIGNKSVTNKRVVIIR